MSLNCLNLYNLKLFQSALVWRLYFIMNNTISSQIPTLENLNGCDELIEFLKENYQNPVCGDVLFQGDVVNINGYGTPMNASEFIPVSEDSMEYFIVGGVNEVTDTNV